MGSIRARHNEACENFLFFRHPEYLTMAVDFVLDAFENESQHEAAMDEALQRARKLSQTDGAEDIQKIIEQLGQLFDRAYLKKANGRHFCRHPPPGSRTGT